MRKEHLYQATTTWVGHDPKTPFTYQSYDRSHNFEVDGKPCLNLSADANFLGDQKTLNPEDCLIAALSSCHMLSYLAFAAMRNVMVISYVDHATGVMLQEGSGGRFTKVTLAPTDLLKDVMEPVRSILKQRGGSVGVSIECSDSIIVNTDCLRLKQVRYS